MTAGKLPNTLLLESKSNVYETLGIYKRSRLFLTTPRRGARKLLGDALTPTSDAAVRSCHITNDTGQPHGKQLPPRVQGCAGRGGGRTRRASGQEETTRPTATQQQPLRTLCLWGLGPGGPQSQYFPILRTICQASKFALGLTSIPPGGAERKANPQEGEVKISLSHR